MNKVALASQGQIKFLNFQTFTEESQDRIEINKSAGQITHMHWTRDGSIMSIATSQGFFLGFLTVVP
jgi:hypothetical protein